MSTNLKDKTTTELRVLKEKLEMELNGRTEEVHVPIIKVLNNGEWEYYDEETVLNHGEYLLGSMKRALSTKDKIFNIKVEMMPESDYKDKKKHGEI